MFYYTLELDDASKELCTIVMPFGKFQYCWMAMELKLAPDVAQSLIEQIVKGLDVDVYIGDCGIFTNGLINKHFALVDKVLQRLQENGCKINPFKM